METHSAIAWGFYSISGFIFMHIVVFTNIEAIAYKIEAQSAWVEHYIENFFTITARQNAAKHARATSIVLSVSRPGFAANESIYTSYSPL